MEEKPHGLKSIFAMLIALALFMPLLSAVTGNQGNAGHVMAEGCAEPQPNYVIGRDLIVSYDEPENENDALHPAVAFTPIGSPFEESIHVVWDEADEFSGLKEIHYSRSLDGGKSWNNDRQDFIISSIQKSNSGNAVNPSVAVDRQGVVHVVWAEQMQTDGTWEVLYSRSMDNGETWTGSTTGDVIISKREGNEGDGFTMSSPKMVAGIGKDKAPDILHVVWSEFNPKNGWEVHYSRSVDGGNQWSGMEADQIISTPNGIDAHNPVIAYTGFDSRFLHVAWSQVSPYGLDEVFYVSSEAWGEWGSWGEEEPISLVEDDGMVVQNVTIAGGYADDVHVFWSQYDKNGGTETEMFYSSSPDNGYTWTGRAKDSMISFPDGNKVTMPSASSSPERIQVVWAEMDETTPYKTTEIHTSWSENPFEPESWTGLKGDIVLSYGDEWGPANAQNVSMILGTYKGVWGPICVWDEPNDGPTKARKNTEIHTNPMEWTLTVDVSGSGIVAVNPDWEVYPNNETVTLTANPSTGWSFSHWGGNLTGSKNPETILMDYDKHVIAYFTQNHYTLSINVDGSGSVSKAPDQATYTHGQTVTMTATPGFGWSFNYWSGSVGGSTNPRDITMDSNKVVNAYFAQNIFLTNLTVGWNLVSLPFVQADTSVATVLSSINGSYNSVKHYSNTGGSASWKSYRPGSPANDLTDIDHTMAFWIHVTSACQLAVYGDIPASTDINLYAGWNLVGYPTLDGGKTVGTALAGTGYDYVEGFQSESPYVKILLNTDPMSPGSGYWVRVPSDTVWTVDW